MLCAVQDSLASTITGGLYYVTPSGVFPVNIYGTSGGGGGGGMAIGASVSSSTPGSILFANGSSFLAQDNNNFYWDYTNFGLGLNNNSPAADAEIYHNAGGNKLAGLILSGNGSSNGNNYLDFVFNRGTRTSPVGPNSLDSAGSIRWRKYTGSAEQTIAMIKGKVTGTPSGTTIPGELDFLTNNSAVPSFLTQSMSIDNTQTTNILHAVVGSSATTPDANAQYSIAEIIGVEPNLGYGATLMLNDQRGPNLDAGARLMWGTETGSSNVFTGGSFIQGYKANSTSGNYSAGLRFFTRLNGAAQAEAMRISENQHVEVADTVDGGQAFQDGSTSYFGDTMQLAKTPVSFPADSILTKGANSTVHANSFYGLVKNNPLVSASSNGSSFAVANCSSPGTAHFVNGSVGGLVNTGYVTVTVTAANTLTQLEIYPGVYTVTATTDVVGPLTAWNNTSTGNVAGYCSGVTSDNGVLLSFYPTATGSYTIYFQFNQIPH